MKIMSQGAAVAALIASAACPAGAHAQDADQRAADAPATVADSTEIIVTATRREQNLRDVPAAVTALSGSMLTDARMTNVNELNAVVPSLQVNRNNSNIGFTIRGIGSQFRSEGTDNSIALHQDGVYVARPAAASNAFFDVERIEVLSGPQGTLYGRNATAGAINIISRLPTTDTRGYIALTAGNYRTIEAEGAVGGPIAGDVLLARVGAYSRNRFQGYGKNLTTGDEIDNLHEWGVKGSLLLQPGADFKAILRADYYGANDNAYGVLLRGAAPNRTPVAFDAGGIPITLAESRGGRRAGNPRDSYADLPTSRHVDDFAASLEMSIRATDWLTIKSLSGYRNLSSYFETDFDQTQLNVASFTTAIKASQFSQELTANLGADRFDGLIGLYYFHEKAFSNLDAPFPGVARPPAGTGIYLQRGTIRTDAYAAFANGEYEVLDGLKLGAGVRFNRERKTNEGVFSAIFTPLAPFSGERTWEGTTPRFTISYKASDQVNLYANVSRGFKSGQWLVGQPVAVNPESVWAYEAGMKARFGGFDTSLSGFHYDYKDLQIQRVLNGLAILQNTPGAKISGVEWNNTLRIGEGFEFNWSATLLDTSIEGFMSQNPNLPGAAVPGQPNTPSPIIQDLTGNRLPYAPKLTWRAGAQKRFDFGDASGTFRVDWTHTSETFLDIFNDRINSYRPAYSLFDISYRHEFAMSGLSATLWVKNLTDERVVMNDNVSLGALGNPEFVNYNPPRTFGATLRYGFGR